MPLMGAVPPTPGFTTREGPPPGSVEKWLAETPERNKAIIERAKRSQESPLAAKCWQKTLEEAEAGWIGEP